MSSGVRVIVDSYMWSAGTLLSFAACILQALSLEQPVLMGVVPLL